MLCRGSCWMLKRDYVGRRWLINGGTGQQGGHKRRIFVTCSGRGLVTWMWFLIEYMESDTTLWLSRSLSMLCSWWWHMVHCTIWRGHTYKIGARDWEGMWWPYSLIIARYLIKSFSNSTKLTTTTNFPILLYLWRGLGKQSISLKNFMITSWLLYRSKQISCRVPSLLGRSQA